MSFVIVLNIPLRKVKLTLRYIRLVPYWPIIFAALKTLDNNHWYCVAKTPSLELVCSRFFVYSVSQMVLHVLVGASDPPPLLSSSFQRLYTSKQIESVL